jgi:uncharacterized damage-inducible protein DinB
VYRSIHDFTSDWKYESEATGKLLEALTDASLSQSVTPRDRTLGRMAWHLVLSIPEMMNRTGLRLDGPDDSAPVPAAARAIAGAYAQVADGLLAAVEKSWTDATLDVEDDMYGERWKRGTTLDVLIKHQTHHRGQMTVLMRQAGVVVPGVYGPAREEWSTIGAEPPAV